MPITDSYIQNSSRGYGKASQEEVYSYIIEKLEGVVAGNNLPDVDHTGRVSKRFAYNLLAKTNLAAGWDLGVDVSDDGLLQPTRRARSILRMLPSMLSWLLAARRSPWTSAQCGMLPMTTMMT